MAVITPILKKQGLDPESLNNYQTISNLLLLSTIQECTVVAQLQSHMSHHELYEPMQTGFQAKHSTETALVKVIKYVFLQADCGKLTLLILLDLSAAFDTVCHNIHLDHLDRLQGISGSAHA